MTTNSRNHVNSFVTGKFFIAQGGAPEYNLTLWNIEKAPKLLYVHKVSIVHVGIKFFIISILIGVIYICFGCRQSLGMIKP